MMKYITELLQILIKEDEDGLARRFGINMFDLFKEIPEELGKLDTLNFLPSDRAEFVLLRRYFIKMGQVNSYSGLEVQKINAIKLVKILENYSTDNAAISTRTFNFLEDDELREIVVRDYNELNNILFKEGAWKSCVIMCGSILEAILFDVLLNKKNYETSIKSAKVPKDRNKNPIKEDKWKLCNLIEIAEETEVLSQQRSKTIDQVLRDYRNFVHPKKEIKAKHPCTEAEALMAKGALDAVCNQLEKSIEE